jgi:hypothetical protein
VFYGWICSEIILSTILPRFRQYRSCAKLERKDRGSGISVIIGVITSVFVAFAFSQVKITLLLDWIFYPGIALMIGGLRQWSIAILGKYFSMLVSIQKEQPIVHASLGYYEAAYC